MKALIRSAEKETLPQFSAEANANVDTIVISVLVDFADEEGNVLHSQRYARRPEEFDEGEFDRIAQSMQDDADHLVNHAETHERNRLADIAIEKLGGRIVRMNVGDGVPLQSSADLRQPEKQ